MTKTIESVLLNRSWPGSGEVWDIVDTRVRRLFLARSFTRNRDGGLRMAMSVRVVMGRHNDRVERRGAQHLSHMDPGPPSHERGPRSLATSQAKNIRPD